MLSVAALFGADPQWAEDDMKEVLDFEMSLAEIQQEVAEIEKEREAEKEEQKAEAEVLKRQKKQGERKRHAEEHVVKVKELPRGKGGLPKVRKRNTLVF